MIILSKGRWYMAIRAPHLAFVTRPVSFPEGCAMLRFGEATPT